MKYGVFGGVFDPIHNEHVKILINSHQKLNLDAIILVPSFNPPHKNQCLADYEDRLKMIDLCVSDIPWVIVDCIEKDLNLADSYSYLILEKLLCKYKGSFTYIIGGDSLSNFSNWKNPNIIAQMVKLAVFPRKGYHDLNKCAEEMRQNYNASIELIDFDLDDVSSSEIRALIEVKSPRARGMLSDKVYDYIVNNNIYSEYSQIISKFKKSVSAKLYAHSIETAIYAVKLASRKGLSFAESFLAGLLHDCGKEDTFDKAEFLNVPNAVVHQYKSAQKAEIYFGITNKNIIDAIRTHTTGCPNMSTLSKIVFVADKIDFSRKYLDVIKLREIVDNDFEAGFEMLLTEGYKRLRKKGNEIDKLTKETISWYNKTKL